MDDSRQDRSVARRSRRRRDAYALDGIFRRSLPFMFAVLLGLALLPIQNTPIDASLLTLSVIAICIVFGSGALATSNPAISVWVLRLLPYLFLLAIVLLRTSTGGARSGYAALMYLAPFWVALSDTRRQVVLVTVAMFFAHIVQGVHSTDLAPAVVVRSALMSSVVIGIISLAVQTSTASQRRAHARLRSESEARAEANTALARSNRDLEQFAWVASHDLQEPLRMIRSFSQLLQQRHSEQLDHDGRELLGFVHDGSERAQVLVTDLLEFSRLGTADAPKRVVALDDVMERVVDTLAPQIAETSARVTISEPLPSVIGNEQQLQRLFVNLVGNAIKYRATDRAPLVRIHATREADLVQVEVADNGIGFQGGHADRIFGISQRLHSREEYDGTGIGLAICARIVEHHGGSIGATSIEGAGSTFTLTLEAAP